MNNPKPPSTAGYKTPAFLFSHQKPQKAAKPSQCGTVSTDKLSYTNSSISKRAPTSNGKNKHRSSSSPMLAIMKG